MTAAEARAAVPGRAGLREKNKRAGGGQGAGASWRITDKGIWEKTEARNPGSSPGGGALSPEPPVASSHSSRTLGYEIPQVCFAFNLCTSKPALASAARQERGYPSGSPLSAPCPGVRALWGLQAGLRPGANRRPAALARRNDPLPAKCHPPTHALPERGRRAGAAPDPSPQGAPMADLASRAVAGAPCAARDARGGNAPLRWPRAGPLLYPHPPPRKNSEMN